MRTAINLVSIVDHKILLVKKKETWILPGGKPNKDESDLDCLKRECSEELQNTSVEVGDFYGNFEGQTPHTGDTLCAKVFFGTIFGDVTPSAEIADLGYFTKNESDQMALSKITRDILTSLTNSHNFF